MRVLVESRFDVQAPPEEALAAAVAAFEAIGYRVARLEARLARLERGAPGTSWRRFDLGRCHTLLALGAAPRAGGGALIGVTYDVEATGQLVSQLDRKVFEAEVLDVAAALAGLPGRARAEVARARQACQDALAIGFGVWAAGVPLIPSLAGTALVSSVAGSMLLGWLVLGAFVPFLLVAGVAEWGVERGRGVVALRRLAARQVDL